MRFRAFAVWIGITTFSGCGGSIDSNATGAGQSRSTGTPGDPSNTSSSSSSGSSPAVGSRPACAIKTPIREDFETGLNSSWGAANPGGLSFDESQPISGKKSLKIALASPLLVMKRAYLSREVPSSCALTLKITVRAAAPLFKPQETAILVRLGTQPSFLDVVLGENGSVALDEVLSDQHEPHPVGTLAADTATAMMIELDLQAKQITTSMAPLGSPPGAPTKSTLLLAHSEVANVVVGLFLATASAGTYWLDDFSLE